MSRAWAVVVSLRTTAVLMTVVGVLLLLNATLPQAALDPEGFARVAQRGGLVRFLLVDVGLGALSTSVPFVATLVAFFVNLGAVLVDRLGATLRRLRRGLPGGPAIQAMLADAPVVELPVSIDEGRVRAVLMTLGFRVEPAGARVIWGVKHRHALLGFPVFHAAFFVMAVGALLLYLTRHVVSVVAAEGQEVSSASGAVLRPAPGGAPGPVALRVERVDVALERGFPIDLGAVVHLAGAGEQAARVNHPAVWGDLTVIAERAGVAPVLWLVDPNGFTVDRVVVITATTGDLPARVPLGAGELTAVVERIPLGPGFPERGALPDVPIELRVLRGGEPVYSGALRAGEAADLGDASLRLVEVRYWAGLRLVRERGGGWLVAGFVLSLLGIAWRLVWHRREVVVEWSGTRLRVGGRSELYPGRFRTELERVAALIAGELSREGGR